MQQQQDAHLRFNLEKMGMAGMPQERLLPTLSSQSLPERLRNKAPLKHPRQRVALFAGCMVNYAYPQLGVDCYDILMANQVQMLTIAQEACCGLPAIMSGDTTAGPHHGSKKISKLSVRKIMII